MKINLMNKPLLVTSQQLERTLFQPYSPSVVSRKEISNKIQIIQVEGLLLHRFDGLGSSYESIRSQLRDALQSETVEQIVLEIDSGGGEINGLFDLVDEIVDARKIKPITALVNECAFSAAYLIASGASQIIAPRTGSVGSIGVMVAHCDQSEAEKRMGFKFTEIYAGKHKIDFSPHQPLSKSAQLTLQEQVDKTYQLLLETLARNRKIPESVFRDTSAQIYGSDKALSLQLIDKIGSPHKVIEELIMKEDIAELSDNFDIKQLLVNERERIKGIMNLCALAKNTVSFENLIESGMSIDAARSFLFEQMTVNVGEPIPNTLALQSSQNPMLHYMIQGLKGA